MTPLVEARRLEARYGGTPALSGLDAAFDAGEIVAILGENGSGKSTLLKAIARIVSPAGGELLLEGRPLSGLPRRDTARRIAYLPQTVDLVFPIRCLDLVLQGRAPYAQDFAAESAEDLRLARDAMRACDVSGLADRDASALSGGERRRVFLARALAQEAEIWLLDEPTSGLDPRHRLEFLELLARVHAERGTTVLLVTHEMETAANAADRALFLRGGRTLAFGTTRATLTPENIAAAFGVEARVSEDASGRLRVEPLRPSL
ncbi:MAG: ABC transporter ATP-binding protein [Thermoanaerobaculia bacterium]